MGYLDQASAEALASLNEDVLNDDVYAPLDQATDLCLSQNGQQPESSLLKPDDWLPEDLQYIGFQDSSGNWRCKHGGCAYDKTFIRACDLRKHYRSHLKFFFCDVPACTSAKTGFSTRKDLQRHMRSHRPEISCPEPGCERVFGRADNMRSHYVKMHQSAKNSIFPRTCRKPRKKTKETPGTLVDLCTVVQTTNSAESTPWPGDYLNDRYT
ncbi:hypothetical protein C7974DRAFT_319542 [Boeremia exigua]|uniref:uncharacterized protein n=1 Tax=Boeremia exigua TaxID=749465 RepID=UPI001E8EC943|nr:uncharacterized protein C7974DRAFT_319542 [Boeremia exigua]KAH6616865.1 hypothetical protein C7974DRAFT_319542 [Boeremia exigua]